MGKILSKNDEGKSEELSYNRDVPGTITTGHNNVRWQFFIRDFSGPYIYSIFSGYLKNEKDSFSMQLYSSFDADLVLVNPYGSNLTALKYKIKPFYTWIRHDLQAHYQQAIATLFAVIIGIKDF